MRWSNLSTEVEERARLPGYRDDAVVRHYEAPGAVRTRFYEVRAKSVLNRVPEASHVPFRWTVNPYRGCTHACVYCLGGETAVLLADGRTKAIAELRPGERIYGTVAEGSARRVMEGSARRVTEASGRRLSVTTVLDKWSSVKPAWEVELEDGTTLWASEEHRFLSARGWRHVTGGEDGRPHLAAGIELIGTGGGADQPEALGSDPALRVVSIRPLGTAMRMYDITTGTGDFIANGVVSHNCFARPTHKYLDFDAGRDFEREIVVKVNAPERLRAELARPSWKAEHVALGTNTDPYQWVEGRYKLMPGIWEAFRDAANPCSVLTKSPLLLRDLPLMQEIAARTDFSAALSVPTLEERAWRATEPHTPNPRARLEAVAELTRAGIRTGVLVAPLMPGINDDPAQVAGILELASEAGAAYVSGIALHLRGDVRGLFLDWLRDHRPDLVPRYEALYARGAYAPAAERRRLAELVKGPDVPPGERMRGRSDFPPPVHRASALEQGRLF